MARVLLKITVLALVIVVALPADLPPLWKRRNAQLPRMMLRGGGLLVDEQEHERSPLGRKEYWEGVYERELFGFEELGDPGESWFEEENGCMLRVSTWMAEVLCTERKEHLEVLDVGTGNGMMLIQLAQMGFRALTGTDYVGDAVELARRNLERAREVGGSLHHISTNSNEEQLRLTVLQDDLLCSRLNGTYDVLHDKGTLDAILLAGTQKVGQYVKATAALTKTGGILVITSCNLTSKELIAALQDGERWRHAGGLAYPCFHFGGSTGSKVVTEAFTRLA